MHPPLRRRGLTPRRALSLLCSALLLTSLAVAIEAPPAQAADRRAVQGIQFGWPVDWDACNRYPNVGRFLNDATMVARTSWIRMDLRGAGGNACGGIDAQYGSIINEVKALRPSAPIKVIGLLSHEIIKGAEVATLDAATYAAAAATVACNPNFAGVDVWEIGNEPNHWQTHLAPEVYAQWVGLASRVIHDCNANDIVISGGVVPGDKDSPDHPVTYLQAVNSAFAAAGGIGNYPNLWAAIDGIGVHPYVDAVAANVAGHGPLGAFIGAVAALGLPQYVTEWGFRLPDGEMDRPDEVTEMGQCLNLVKGFARLAAFGKNTVAAATWFTMSDFGVQSQLYGLYDIDGLPRPALRGYNHDACDGASNGYFDPTNVALGWTAPAAALAGGRSSLSAATFEVAVARVGETTYTRTQTTGATVLPLAAFNPPLTADSYNWQVTTIRDGIRYPSAEWQFTYGGAPAPPSSASTSSTASSVTLTWLDNSNNESGFQIGLGSAVATAGINAQSYTWTGLAQATQYCFTIRAVNPVGSSPPIPVCGTTQSLPVAPSAPNAAVASGTSVLVSWTDNSNNENGFEISNLTTSNVVITNTTSFLWTGLANGVNTCFRVRAYNLYGYSAWTTNVCATTPTIPIAPNTQTAAVATGTSIRVGWADRSTNEIGFEISNGTTSNVVGAGSTSFTWGGLANGTYMCFKVRSYNLAGYSAWTPNACATTPVIPAAPTTPIAAAITGTQVRIGWTDVSNNEIGFEISNGTTSNVVGANGVVYNWNGVGMGTTTCYRVRAYNLAGYSAWTPSVCVTTPTLPTAPISPYASASSSTSITVSWTDRSYNENGFEISNGTTSRFVGANGTGLIWSGLSPGTYMCFQVRAYNTAGSSAYTTPWACATTPAPPNAPANPWAAPLNTSQLRFTWYDLSPNETGFQVFDGVTYYNLPANTTGFIRSGLPSHYYMCLQVRSYNAAGYSAWTPWSCATTY